MSGHFLTHSESALVKCGPVYLSAAILELWVLLIINIKFKSVSHKLYRA
jgi:hypothetical protein